MPRKSCVNKGEADLTAKLDSEAQASGEHTRSASFDSTEPMATQPNRAPSSSHGNAPCTSSAFEAAGVPDNAGSIPKKKESSGCTEKRSAKGSASTTFELPFRRPVPARSDDSKDGSTPEMLVPPCLLDEDEWGLLYTATTSPPVTTATLKELGLKWIQNNINLRNDIHYDHDLHFMPVSGARREEKRIEARQYWRCLTIEFRIYQHNSSLQDCPACRESTQQPQKHFVRRLPTMFTELRELLISLVPEDDRPQVEGKMEVDWLMYQVENGVLDVVQLSDWLAELLTTHCAPIRDELAEDMARKVTEGACQGDMGSLVLGLEKLFMFLEAMKLDVANHQIRTFRCPLIEDGVAFQQEYFATRIANHKLDPTESREWYNSMRLQMVSPNEAKAPAINPLVWGLASLCSHHNSNIPATLKHDLSRIRQLQEEVQDIIHLQICLDIFDDLVRRQTGREYPLSPMHTVLQARLMTLTDADNDSDATICDIWNDHIESVSVEITRAAYAFGRQAGGSIAPSCFEETTRRIQDGFADEEASNQGAKRLSRILEQRMIASVNEFQEMSALSISEVQKRYQEMRLAANHGRRIVPDVKDVSRRLAHMAVIHWRVWCNLAYCESTEE